MKLPDGKPLKLFRYQGSKTRVLKLLRDPPSGTRIVVEPFLGSGAYWLNSGLPGFGLDTSIPVVQLWLALAHITPKRLWELDKIVKQAKPKTDVREIPNLSPGEQAYIRVNVTSFVVGQLSSWKIYPQHNLPVEKTIRALPRLKDLIVVRGSAGTYDPQPGDLVFLDPPYHGTRGYSSKNRGNKYSHIKSQVDKLISTCGEKGIPVIFTYGDNADSLWNLDWISLAPTMAKGIRTGGVRRRTTHVAYLNWPQQEDSGA